MQKIVFFFLLTVKNYSIELLDFIQNEPFGKYLSMSVVLFKFVQAMTPPTLSAKDIKLDSSNIENNPLKFFIRNYFIILRFYIKWSKMVQTRFMFVYLTPFTTILKIVTTA